MNDWLELISSFSGKLHETFPRLERKSMEESVKEAAEISYFRKYDRSYSKECPSSVYEPEMSRRYYVADVSQCFTGEQIAAKPEVLTPWFGHLVILKLKDSVLYVSACPNQEVADTFVDTTVEGKKKKEKLSR
jgi:hypothetical protein